MTELDKKLDQYEITAVSVANKMHNDNLRAEGSKEVLKNFPSVRLASEKTKQKMEWKGQKILSSLILSTLLGVGCYCIGYSKGIYSETPEIKKSFKRTITELIDKDLKERGDFVFLGGLDTFSEIYAVHLLGEKPDNQQLQIIKEYMHNCVEPMQGYSIDETIKKWDDKTFLVYKRKILEEK